MRTLLLMMLACWMAAIGCASSKGVVHRAAVGAIGPYSGSVIAGDTCFVSGKIAPEAKSGGAFADEVHGVVDALVDELAASGLSLRDVVNSTVYLTDMKLFPEFNRVYGERFPQPYPARTTVGVAELPAGRRIEMSVIAHLGGGI